MATTQDSQKLHIAIAGAGIAGLTAAIALLKHPLITVSIYEKSNELKEIGASIALGPNGLRTLERLGLEDVISDDVAFRGPANLAMIYRHVSRMVCFEIYSDGNSGKRTRLLGMIRTRL